VLTALRSQTAAMVEALAALVSVESPSTDARATADCAAEAARLGHRLLGMAPEWCRAQGREHLRWTFGRPRVLLLGHLDTVWPLGTLARWPFSVMAGKATGPGVFDMKAGLVQGLFGLSVLDDLDGVCVLVTCDEEIGSPTSRALVEDSARGLEAALVLEPGALGAVKIGRKGTATYRLRVQGRAAHAGLEPEKGANALVELAHQVLAAQELARPDVGPTVTATMAGAGTATNVVPAVAWAEIDVRAASVAEQQRVDQELRVLTRRARGTRLEISGAPNRPPLPISASQSLLARARAVHAQLGLGQLDGVIVGGGSDGNFTAGVGTPTLDGLGAVGGGAHAEGEHVLVDQMADRAALVARLTGDLLAPPSM